MNTLWGRLWAHSAVIGGVIFYQLSLWGPDTLANARDFNLLTLGHSIAHKPFAASRSNAVLAGYGSACFEWTLFSPGPTIMASCLLYTKECVWWPLSIIIIIYSSRLSSPPPCSINVSVLSFPLQLHMARLWFPLVVIVVVCLFGNSVCCCVHSAAVQCFWRAPLGRRYSRYSFLPWLASLPLRNASWTSPCSSNPLASWVKYDPRERKTQFNHTSLQELKENLKHIKSLAECNLMYFYWNRLDEELVSFYVLIPLLTFIQWGTRASWGVSETFKKVKQLWNKQKENYSCNSKNVK